MLCLGIESTAHTFGCSIISSNKKENNKVIKIMMILYYLKLGIFIKQMQDGELIQKKHPSIMHKLHQKY